MENTKEKVVLATVDHEYNKYLYSIDSHVAYKDDTTSKPFIGIILKINGWTYFAPLYSPRKKYLDMKNSVDFVKIKKGTLGVINLNNMIPVLEDYYSVIQINDLMKNEETSKYGVLIKRQYRWMKVNYEYIINKAFKLYYSVTEKPNFQNVRCCDFKRLENASKNYKHL